MNDFFKGTSTSTGQTTLSSKTILDMMEDAKKLLKSRPPRIRVQYSEFVDDDEIFEIDMKKFKPLGFISPVFNFVENWDLWYIIGKNMIEKFEEKGIKVHGKKDDE